MTEGAVSRGRGRRAWLLLPLALSIAGAAFLFRPQRPQRPSAILITVDTLRPDRLGCYGHPTNKTPAIDRLAREGVLFEHAYCDMPWTTGSMASVMTGRYSNEHGLRDPASKLDPDVVTTAQVLHEHGMQTGAIIGSFPLDSIYGLDRGFETYDDTFTTPMLVDPSAPVKKIEGSLPENFADQAAFVEEKQENEWYRPDESVTDAAIHWLDRIRDGRPFFLWVHYFGPHERLDRTRDPVTQEPEIIAAYDGAVESTDHAVGRLIDHLRDLDILADNLVILHADHGQNLGENEYVGHTLRLDEVAVHVPMIVHYPERLTGGVRRRDIARNIDIRPTILAATGIESVKTPGRSLLPTRDDPWGIHVPADQQVAYFETYLPLYFFVPQTTRGLGTLLGPMVSRGVRTPRWKYLANEFRGDCVWGAYPSRDGVGAWQLQDTRPLPAARCAEIGGTELYRATNTTAEGLEKVDPPVPGAAVAELEAEIHKHEDRQGAAVGEKFTLSPEQENKLKGLGYLR